MTRFAQRAPRKPYEGGNFRVDDGGNGGHRPARGSPYGHGDGAARNRPPFKDGKGWRSNLPNRPGSARRQHQVCFVCREPGHQSADCPQAADVGVGACYHCNAMDHTSKRCTLPKEEQLFRFSRCFVCKGEGHLSGQCPKNEKGLYVNGGACRLCGSKTHFVSDCPKTMVDTKNEALYVGTGSANQGGDDDDLLETEFTRDAVKRRPPTAVTATRAAAARPAKKGPKVVNF
ncbi:Zinc finger CCHC domain-containing protein 9 [Tieghemiomyces parasiticus]|uniref:Zinc finger CCHC domain-containing protein 9 n=1 Tax=Tieghemiomyces parasiticus TaxID=78921 RepID=A0A9W8AEB8_9FUNG|nr:Zinc finger CCHC domain-containing protein 9 [Tieghemiomyces parasiticus]